MKINKKGFTLAEVLIVIAIIGVVSSLTLPTLMSRNASAKIGTTLGRVRHILSSANDSLLQQNEVQSLTNVTNNCTLPDGQNRMSVNCNYFNTVAPFIKGATVYTNNNITGDNKQSLSLPIGVNIDWDAGYTLLQSNRQTFGTIRVLLAPNEPNDRQRSGRNVFYFSIENNGNIVPIGSQRFGSQNNGPCMAVGIGNDNTGCAGVIFDNGLTLPENYNIPR